MNKDWIEGYKEALSDMETSIQIAIEGIQDDILTMETYEIAIDSIIATLYVSKFNIDRYEDEVLGICYQEEITKEEI